MTTGLTCGVSVFYCTFFWLDTFRGSVLHLSSQRSMLIRDLNVSEDARTVMIGLLQTEPNERLSLEDALETGWMLTADGLEGDAASGSLPKRIRTKTECVDD